MHIDIHDTQIVGEYETTIFTLLAQGLTDTVFMLTNAGVNTLSYRFQDNSGNEWRDIGGAGTQYYSSLVPGSSRTLSVSTQAAHIRMVGSASGGSAVQFSIVRNHPRAAGGAIPVVGF